MHSRKTLAFAVCVCGLVGLLFTTGNIVAGGTWRAAPIMVHEWGVSTFVWSRSGSHPAANLPSFFYTDQRPGKPLDGTLDVRNFPPDHRTKELMARIRAFRKASDVKWYWKPLLYFYPHGSALSVPVGLSVDFPAGKAKAWYPQVDALNAPNVRVVGSRAAVKPQLVWRRLSLRKKAGKGFRRAAALRDGEKWIRHARDADSAYVSNGFESEKFVFYEGASRETPFISVLPFGGPGGAIANTGDFPIHDVFVIHRRGDSVWSAYLSKLPPIPSVHGKADSSQVTVLPLPDFRDARIRTRESKNATAARLGTRLIEVLSSGAVIGAGKMHRNPRQSQPRTTSHYLYRKEAAGLEKIWRDELFKNEGLTVIYREDPAYLDRIMPLRIYTDRAHYIMLSRCGLVLNRNIPLGKVRGLYDSLRRSGPGPRHLKNRFISLGLLEFMSRRGMQDPAKLRRWRRDLSRASLR